MRSLNYDDVLVEDLKWAAWFVVARWVALIRLAIIILHLILMILINKWVAYVLLYLYRILMLLRLFLLIIGYLVAHQTNLISIAHLVRLLETMMHCCLFIRLLLILHLMRHIRMIGLIPIGHLLHHRCSTRAHPLGIHYLHIVTLTTLPIRLVHCLRSFIIIHHLLKLAWLLIHIIWRRSHHLHLRLMMTMLLIKVRVVMCIETLILLQHLVTTRLKMVLVIRHF